LKTTLFLQQIFNLTVVAQQKYFSGYHCSAENFFYDASGESFFYNSACFHSKFGKGG